MGFFLQRDEDEEKAKKDDLASLDVLCFLVHAAQGPQGGYGRRIIRADRKEEGRG